MKYFLLLFIVSLFGCGDLGVDSTVDGEIVRIDVIVDCSNEPLTELEKGLCEKALGEETTDVIETPPETPPEIPPETPPETEEPPTTEPIVE